LLSAEIELSGRKPKNRRDSSLTSDDEVLTSDDEYFWEDRFASASALASTSGLPLDSSPSDEAAPSPQVASETYLAADLANMTVEEDHDVQRVDFYDLTPIIDFQSEVADPDAEKIEAEFEYKVIVEGDIMDCLNRASRRFACLSGFATLIEQSALHDPRKHPEFSDWGPSTAASRSVCLVILMSCVHVAEIKKKVEPYFIPNLLIANASGGFSLFWKRDEKIWKCDVFGFGYFPIVFYELLSEGSSSLLAKGTHLLDPNLASFRDFLLHK